MNKSLEELFQRTLPAIQSKLHRELDEKTKLRVSWQDLKIGEPCHFQGDQSGWAASIIKIPVMIAAFQQIDKGALSLDDTLPIDHRFTLDSTSEISFREQGSPAEVSELLSYMILASCNESTNMLAERVGIPFINEAMRTYGCPLTRMSHLLYRGAPLVDPGIDGTSSNTTTANEMNRLMVGIYTENIASPLACRRMKAILENSPELEYGGAVVNTLLSSPLPVGTIVGTKMGLLDEDVMATAVVNRDYALTIMVNKVPVHAMSSVMPLLPAISNEIFRQYYHG